MSARKDPPEDNLRPHSYDGIQEYDKRLPNWWLWTLYGAIIYAIAYWGITVTWHHAQTPEATLEDTMEHNQIVAASSTGVVTDEMLWHMSREGDIAAAGKAMFASTCVTCHQTDLSGGIGPNLKDELWIHGGLPSQIVSTITTGVKEKGMPTWGPILGRQRINEVAAYILSFHTPPAPSPPK